MTTAGPDGPTSPARNRVAPDGSIVAVAQRGLFLGNRGCIHRAPGVIARPWQVRRWITCRLEYKGWVAPKWASGRWTALFFWDEAVALAAGHRPCALCRRPDFDRWCDAWAAAFGRRDRVDPMDRRLHADRVVPGWSARRAGGDAGGGTTGGWQRRHERPWPELPVGTFVALDEGPALVLDDRVVPWSPAGYGSAADRPVRGPATVLTPAATVEVLRHGYRPVVHPSAPAG
ncbi:MAG TPA: hypothetical protein VIL36_23045 [Acidimicrobiales bacterium]